MPVNNLKSISNRCSYSEFDILPALKDVDTYRVQTRVWFASVGYSVICQPDCTIPPQTNTAYPPLKYYGHH